MTESIGMMNEAYFVGRGELIKWVNSFLQLNITKVEDCASGAIHCQLFDAIYPGKVPMHKVDFDAKYDYEFVKNYKILQDVFERIGVTKIIPVDRIVKARSQDNLEFLQWVYEHFNRNYVDHEYDAIKRRSKAKGGDKFKGSRQGGSGKENAHTRAAAPAPASKPSAVSASKPAQMNKNHPAKQTPSNDAEVASLKSIIRDLEKERDFYFEKITQVEKMIKAYPNVDMQEHAVLDQILEILYATDDDHVPEADGRGEDIRA